VCPTPLLPLNLSSSDGNESLAGQAVAGSRRGWVCGGAEWPVMSASGVGLRADTTSGPGRAPASRMSDDIGPSRFACAGGGRSESRLDGPSPRPDGLQVLLDDPGVT
jgi:hypothetical protein